VVVWALVNWLDGRPWRAGALLAAAVVVGVGSPLAGGVAWLVAAPLATFVIGYQLWWFFGGWKGAVALGVAVLWAVGAWAVFGVAFDSLTAAAYTLGSVAMTLAFLGGYIWGKRREDQERTPGV
jgi:hypothetical protein